METTEKAKTFYALDEVRSSELMAKYPHFNKPWRLEEMKRIRALFVEDGVRIATIAVQMQRTEKAIRLKLMGMGEIYGFLGREGTPWSEEDRRRMIRFFEQGYPEEDIARFLGRRRKDVREHLEDERFFNNYMYRREELKDDET